MLKKQMLGRAFRTNKATPVVVPYIVEKAIISDGCEPYMYNTEDDLLQFDIGDIVEVKFGKKAFRVKKGLCWQDRLNSSLAIIENTNSA